MEIARNPFLVLGATTHDGRQRIMELAEEKNLLAVEGANEAAAALVHPRRRLSAEVTWFPGLGVEQISAILGVIESNPAEFLDRRGLPALTRANFLAFSLGHAVAKLSASKCSEWIVQLSQACDDLRIEAVIALINEEREVCGIAKIAEPRQVQQEIEDLFQRHRAAIQTELQKLDLEAMIELVTQIVETTAAAGNAGVPVLVSGMVEDYGRMVGGVLEERGKDVAELSDRIREAAAAEKDEAEIVQLVEEFGDAVWKWDSVAQPSQLIARSQGSDHHESDVLSAKIRGLSVDLYNEHGMLDIARQLTELQREVFAENDRVVEQTIEDVSTLGKLAAQRAQMIRQMEEKAEAWKKEITYTVKVGVFGHRLRISPDGIEWKGRKLALDTITRVRWGITRRYVNGIPAGTICDILVGDARRGFTVRLKRPEVLSKFVERLWRTVGVRLLTAMLEGLREGRKYEFGAAVVDDFGIELERRRWFFANDRVPCKWADIVVGHDAGALRIEKRGERKVAVVLPYLDVDNVHILAMGMEEFFKKPTGRISDLLSRG